MHSLPRSDEVVGKIILFSYIDFVVLAGKTCTLKIYAYLTYNIMRPLIFSIVLII